MESNYDSALIECAAAANVTGSVAYLSQELTRRGLVLVPQVDGALIVRGVLPADMVAIVGARQSDPYGLALSRRLSQELALRGIAVVSGGAEGCDHAAHLGAMDVGGKTVVVLPGGHDHLYPRHHAALFERVVATGGAIVSCVWPTTTIHEKRFLQRNRVIARLSRGVIVARAHARSGSLSTAQAAVALGRPLAAVPGNIGSELSEGCHVLLERGAVPMVGPRSLDRWLGRRTGSRSWPVYPRPQQAPWASQDAELPRPVAYEPATAEVLGAVRAEPGLDLDTIAVRTGTPIAALAEIVLGLEIDGVLERWPGGRYHPRAGI